MTSRAALSSPSGGLPALSVVALLLLLSLRPVSLTAAETAPGPPALDLDMLPALPSINDGWPATGSTGQSLDESHARMEQLLGDVVSYVVEERSRSPVFSAVRPEPTRMRARVESRPPPSTDMPDDAGDGSDADDR